MELLQGCDLDTYWKRKGRKLAEKEICCTLKEPFMTMSFLSLSVIPELKLTDKGLMNVDNCEFVDLFAEE